MTTTTLVPHGYGLATATMCGPNMGINWLDQVTLAHPSTKDSESISLSSDGSVLFVGGYGDNSNVGAAWAFNDTFFTLPLCNIPNDTSLITYSSCNSEIFEGSYCTPLCDPGFAILLAVLPEWLALPSFWLLSPNPYYFKCVSEFNSSKCHSICVCSRLFS